MQEDSIEYEGGDKLINIHSQVNKKTSNGYDINLGDDEELVKNGYKAAKKRSMRLGSALLGKGKSRLQSAKSSKYSRIDSARIKPPVQRNQNNANNGTTQRALSKQGERKKENKNKQLLNSKTLKDGGICLKSDDELTNEDDVGEEQNNLVVDHGSSNNEEQKEVDSLIQVDDQSDGTSGAEELDLVEQLGTFYDKKEDKQQSSKPPIAQMSGLQAYLSQMNPDILNSLKQLKGDLEAEADGDHLHSNNRYNKQDDSGEIMKNKLKDFQRREAQRKQAIEDQYKKLDQDGQTNQVMEKRLKGKKKQDFTKEEGEEGGSNHGEEYYSEDEGDAARILREEIEQGFDPKDLVESFDGWEFFKKTKVSKTIIKNYCIAIDQDYMKHKVTVCGHLNNILDLYLNQRRPFMRTVAGDHLDRERTRITSAYSKGPYSNYSQFSNGYSPLKNGERFPQKSIGILQINTETHGKAASQNLSTMSQNSSQIKFIQEKKDEDSADLTCYQKYGIMNPLLSNQIVSSANYYKNRSQGITFQIIPSGKNEDVLKADSIINKVDASIYQNQFGQEFNSTRPIRKVYLNFDKDIAHKMFGYRVRFLPEKQTTFDCKGTPEGFVYQLHKPLNFFIKSKHAQLTDRYLAMTDFFSRQTIVQVLDSDNEEDVVEIEKNKKLIKNGLRSGPNGGNINPKINKRCKNLFWRYYKPEDITDTVYNEVCQPQVQLDQLQIVKNSQNIKKHHPFLYPPFNQDGANADLPNETCDEEPQQFSPVGDYNYGEIVLKQEPVSSFPVQIMQEISLDEQTQSFNNSQKVLNNQKQQQIIGNRFEKLNKSEQKTKKSDQSYNSQGMLGLNINIIKQPSGEGTQQQQSLASFEAQLKATVAGLNSIQQNRPHANSFAQSNQIFQGTSDYQQSSQRVPQTLTELLQMHQKQNQKKNGPYLVQAMQGIKNSESLINYVQQQEGIIQSFGDQSTSINPQLKPLNTQFQQYVQSRLQNYQANSQAILQQILQTQLGGAPSVNKQYQLAPSQVQNFGQSRSNFFNINQQAINSNTLQNKQANTQQQSQHFIFNEQKAQLEGTNRQKQVQKEKVFQVKEKSPLIIHEKFNITLTQGNEFKMVNTRQGTSVQSSNQNRRLQSGKSNYHAKVTDSTTSYQEEIVPIFSSNNLQDNNKLSHPHSQGGKKNLNDARKTVHSENNNYNNTKQRQLIKKNPKTIDQQTSETINPKKNSNQLEIRIVSQISQSENFNDQKLQEDKMILQKTSIGNNNSKMNLKIILNSQGNTEKEPADFISATRQPQASGSEGANTAGSTATSNLTPAIGTNSEVFNKGNSQNITPVAVGVTEKSKFQQFPHSQKSNQRNIVVLNTKQHQNTFQGPLNNSQKMKNSIMKGKDQNQSQNQAYDALSSISEKISESRQHNLIQNDESKQERIKYYESQKQSSIGLVITGLAESKTYDKRNYANKEPQAQSNQKRQSAFACYEGGQNLDIFKTQEKQLTTSFVQYCDTLIGKQKDQKPIQDQSHSDDSKIHAIYNQLQFGPQKSRKTAVRSQMSTLIQDKSKKFQLTEETIQENEELFLPRRHLDVALSKEETARQMNINVTRNSDLFWKPLINSKHGITQQNLSKVGCFINIQTAENLIILNHKNCELPNIPAMAQQSVNYLKEEFLKNSGSKSGSVESSARNTQALPKIIRTSPQKEGSVFMNSQKKPRIKELDKNEKLTT